MPVKQAPEPDDDEEDDVGVDPDVEARDQAYQAGYEDAATDRNWIRACLAVLTAPLDLSDYDPMSLDAVREMRTEAARRIARMLRADIESPLRDEPLPDP